MNIFMLDNNIRCCARYHCDQHIVKMILEYTQILCTVLHLNKGSAPYKLSHQKHPCVIWCNQSLQNWLWLRAPVYAQQDEYQYRYGNKMHKSFIVAKNLCLPVLPAMGLLEHPQVMPEKYQVPNDPIKAYRNCYIFDKSRFASWRRRNPPTWYRNIAIY